MVPGEHLPLIPPAEVTRAGTARRKRQLFDATQDGGLKWHRGSGKQRSVLAMRGAFLADVKLEPVVDDLIAHRLGNLGLQLFDLLIGEFDHRAGVDINHVVVVLGLGMLKPRGRPFKLVAHDHALGLQFGQGTVHR
jgi:hypothetical protein